MTTVTRQKFRYEAAALAAKVVTLFALGSIALLVARAGESAGDYLVCGLSATVLALSAFLGFPRCCDRSTRGADVLSDS